MLVKRLADGQHRIQRGQRLLRDEGDPPAEQGAPAFALERKQVDIVEDHAPPGDLEAAGNLAGNDAADHAFSGAGLADQAKDPAAR
jgi:hypothetical protein